MTSLPNHESQIMINYIKSEMQKSTPSTRPMNIFRHPTDNSPVRHDYDDMTEEASMIVEFWMNEEYANTVTMGYIKINNEVYLCVIPMLLTLELRRVVHEGKTYIRVIVPIQLVDLVTSDLVILPVVPPKGELMICQGLRTTIPRDMLNKHLPVFLSLDRNKCKAAHELIGREMGFREEGLSF